MTITDTLSRGAENARTGREIAKILGCNIRMITAQIERERRAGSPICAISNGENPGYYLAADAEELEEYCNRLEGRENELAETRQALLKVLREYRDIKGAQNDQAKTTGDQ